MSQVEGICRGEYLRCPDECLRCLGSKVSVAANTFDVPGRRYLKIQGLDAHLHDPLHFRLGVRFSGLEAAKNGLLPAHGKDSGSGLETNSEALLASTRQDCAHNGRIKAIRPHHSWEALSSSLLRENYLLLGSGFRTRGGARLD